MAVTRVRSVEAAARSMIAKLHARVGGVHVDLGGEGRYPGAWNINPSTLTSTTGQPGRAIPRLVRAQAERLPLADSSVRLLTVENAPLRPETMREIMRVLQPGGHVVLSHPTEYAARILQQLPRERPLVAVAQAADGVSLLTHLAHAVRPL